MKKLYSQVLLIITLCFVNLNSKAQTLPEQTKSSPEQEPEKPQKCIKKFKSLTDTYYGIPNIWGVILRVAVTDPVTHPTAAGVSVSSIGPTGAKYEFLLTDKFGIGTDVNYSLATVTWKESKTDALNNTAFYSHTAKSGALRTMASFNFHYATKKRFDWYSSFKIGYYNRTLTFTSDEPGYTPPTISRIWTSWHAALRFESGVRIFLAPFLALNFSFGIGGGPVLSSGISSKF